jgi:hypothetical protein
MSTSQDGRSDRTLGVDSTVRPTASRRRMNSRTSFLIYWAREAWTLISVPASVLMPVVATARSLLRRCVNPVRDDGRDGTYGIRPRGGVGP